MTQICSGFASSRFEAADSLDDFPTPPWAGRALIEHVFRRPWNGRVLSTRRMSLWEPAVNRGFLLRGLAPYFYKVRGSDIFDYGIGAEILDYTRAGPQPPVDFVITNPPFNKAEIFMLQALADARVGCAFLLRTAILEGQKRYHNVYRCRPPSFVAHFAERVDIVKGRCDPEASTMTSYCWIGWVRGWDPRPTMWIPPCRDELERAGDYDTSWHLADA